MPTKTKFGWGFQLALLCLLVLIPSLSWAENSRISVLLSDDSAPYQRFATYLKKNLQKAGQSIEIQYLNYPGFQLGSADLVIAVGMNALESTIANDTPVLGVMIPRKSYEVLRTQRSKKLSAVYLDQPYDRQLDLIQATLPRLKNLGVLHSPDAGNAISDLRHDTLERSISLNVQPVKSLDSLYQALETVLDKTDALLVIPDSEIYNSRNIRNILLTSYRHKVPLIGISQGYVNAGALCAIFSTPEQLAEQTAMLVAFFNKTRRLADPQYPTLFTIDFNQQVARSLEILPMSPEVIRERMSRIEQMRKGAK